VKNVIIYSPYCDDLSMQINNIIYQKGNTVCVSVFVAFLIRALVEDAVVVDAHDLVGAVDQKKYHYK
jgi:hypothetical protein